MAVPVVAVLASAYALRIRHEGWSFSLTALAIGGSVAAMFANLYPNVLVSSTDAAYTMTVQGTAANHYALQVMTVVAVVLFPVVLIYQGWSFRVFRARIHVPDDVPEVEQATARP